MTFSGIAAAQRARFSHLDLARANGLSNTGAVHCQGCTAVLSHLFGGRLAGVYPAVHKASSADLVLYSDVFTQQ